MKPMATKHGIQSQRTKDHPVTVQRFRPDIESLVEGIVERLYIPTSELSRYTYVNPLATVECDRGTDEFFHTARKVQAEWCQRTKLTFGRKNCRSVREWTSHQGRLPREARYWERTACWIGLLFIDGRFVPPSQWPRSPQKGKQGRRIVRPTDPERTWQTHEEVIEDLYLLTSADYWQQRFQEVDAA